MIENRYKGSNPTAMGLFLREAPRSFGAAMVNEGKVVQRPWAKGLNT